MRRRSVTGFLHCWQLGYSCTSMRDGTHALHGPQCLQGITRYSALCALQRGHDGSARVGAWPSAAGGAGENLPMGLAGGPPGATGGRNGLGACSLTAPDTAGTAGRAGACSPPPAAASTPAADWGNRHAKSQQSMQDPASCTNAGCGSHRTRWKTAWVRRTREVNVF